MKSWMVFLFLGLYLGSFRNANAQTVVTGELTGTVNDPTGAVVANAKLTLKNDATGESKEDISSSAGQFHFALLRPGTYTLNVMATGFGEYVQKTTVSLGQATNLTVQLALQTQTQTVEVNEVPPLVQSDNANLATTFSNNQLENLPAPGMDMTAYAQTVPGITLSTGGGYGNFSAFGLPAVSNLFTINGNDNMDPYLNLNNSGASNLTLGANEIQEAAVILNGYTGQYGRQAGAQINYVTKSGTNAFHGNAGWLWNGNALNANDWFNNANSTPRPHAVSNQWFDSIGGPIKRDKAFFFFDNEGLRYVLPSGGPVYIPTTAFANAVLANLAATNPASIPLYQQAFNVYSNAPGASRARPVTASEDPALGCGDLAGTIGAFGVTQPCAQTFQQANNSLNTEWLAAGKVDINATDNDRLYFRYNTDHGIQATSTDAINPVFNANSNQPQYGGQFGYTKSIGATMVNQLLLSASYYSAFFGFNDLPSALKTFPNTWNFNDGLFTTLGGSGTFSYSNSPQGRKVRQWQLLDDFSKVVGKHTFKAGVNVRKNWVSSYATQENQSGTLLFNSMTDFYQGSLTNGSTFSQAFPQVGAQNVNLYSAGFYGQDEWKATQRLSITLALRFDRNSNIQCPANCFSELGSPFTAIPHNVSTPYNQVIHAGLGEAFPGMEAIVVAPRIGAAYSLTKNTVLRGGFGIFSDLNQALVADNFLVNSPNVSSFTTGSGLVALNNPKSIYASVANSDAAFVNGFNSGATLAQLQAAVPGFVVPNFNTVASQMKNPKYQEWNVEIQQQFSSRYLLSVNYVGNRGYDEITQNAFQNAYSAKGFVGLPTTDPDARFGQIRELNNQGWSNYNGLVTAFRLRFSNQLTGSFSYTWGHALDTCSNACIGRFDLLQTLPNIRQQISPLGLSVLNYSNADYDVRHSLNANYVYTVPTSYFHNSVLKALLGNWTAAGTFFFKTGYPFSVQDSSVRTVNGIQNWAGLLTGTFLATYLGAGYPTCSTPNVQCLSASMFATASRQNNSGNIPRNSFRGPGYFDTDLNLTKTIPIHERYRFTFGMNFYNILNHANFDVPFNNIAAGNFGQILETVSPPSSPYGSFQGSAVSGRVIQTVAKFTF